MSDRCGYCHQIPPAGDPEPCETDEQAKLCPWLRPDVPPQKNLVVEEIDRKRREAIKAMVAEAQKLGLP